MDTIIIVLLLVVLAELTYLLSQNPGKLLKANTGTRPIFVDTSVLIDGRIIAVAASGFISDTLYIPRSVVGELQFLADKADGDKRARARHGLDVVRELQNLPQATVKIFPDGSKAEEGVDERLLKLAKQHGGAVCTIDFNLNKVAQVEDIAVLNVNELAQNLRMAYLPGEKLMLELTQRGNDSHQAIGHLTDGTMVVVEQASKYVGKKMEIEFIRSLQTAAGRMMFAKLVTPQQVNEKSQTTPKNVAQLRAKVKPAGRQPRQKPMDTSQPVMDEQPQEVKPQPRRGNGRRGHGGKNAQAQQDQPTLQQAGDTSSVPQQRPQVQKSAQQGGNGQNKRPAGQNRRRRPADAESSLVDLANS